MSEFQCYQFKTIDRPLSSEELREVDGLSSRGHVNSTSATFIYHYSDFRHDPATVLEKYFDAMIYFANWGTRRLMFRLPAALVAEEELSRFCLDDEYGSGYITLDQQGDYYLLDIYFYNEGGGGWMEEEDYQLGDLTPLRDDIISGDYRALYLAWMHFTQPLEEDEEFEHSRPEDKAPPVPPNLQHLSAALKAFIDFFEIYDDIVAAAQAVSPANRERNTDYENLLLQLSEEERNNWLFRLLNGEPRLDLLLKKRLEERFPDSAKTDQPALSPSQLHEVILQKEKERKAKEKAEAQAAHLKRMKALAEQEAGLWEGVIFNIERKTGKSYDLATESLEELRELARFQGKEKAFEAKMAELREKFGRRSSLLRRWDRAGLF